MLVSNNNLTLTIEPEKYYKKSVEDNYHRAGVFIQAHMSEWAPVVERAKVKKVSTVIVMFHSMDKVRLFAKTVIHSAYSKHKQIKTLLHTKYYYFT